MEHPGPIATEAEHGAYLRWFHEEEGKKVWFAKLTREGRIGKCQTCGVWLIKLHTLTKKTKKVSTVVKWVELGDGKGQARYNHYFYRRQRKHLEHKCASQ